MYVIQVLQALGEGRHHHAKVWEAAERMFLNNDHDRQVFEALLRRALKSGVVTQHNMGASRQYELLAPMQTPVTSSHLQEDEENG